MTSRYLVSGRRPGRRRPRRWVVERTLAWLSKCRALLIRYDKHDVNYLGLIQLACGLLRYRRIYRLRGVYNPRPDEYERPKLLAQSRYLAGFYSLGELGAQLRRQGAEAGMDSAERWIALTDGGSGFEDFVRVQFPRAELILDFWHAAEYLCDLAKAIHPEDNATSERLGAKWCHTMKHEGGVAVLALLQALDLNGRGPKVNEVHRQTVQYVQNNVHRMDYPRYRARGWQIGSGPVESACKTVVGRRLKGGGMRWGEEGSDAVCHLRALWRSQKGLWEAFWHPSSNKYRSSLPTLKRPTPRDTTTRPDTR